MRAGKRRHCRPNSFAVPAFTPEIRSCAVAARTCSRVRGLFSGMSASKGAAHATTTYRRFSAHLQKFRAGTERLQDFLLSKVISGIVLITPNNPSQDRFCRQRLFVPKCS